MCHPEMILLCSIVVTVSHVLFCQMVGASKEELDEMGSA